MEHSTIGPYRVLRMLGFGGMGQVYLAEDPRLQRNVALKRVSDARLDTPESRERLLNEARAAANLNHPNIAAVFDVIEHEGQPFIVMEYVAGETLLEHVRKGPRSPGEVVDIARQMTSALAEAHEHGIVHRDLKPANVLITPKGCVKILDFGLAKTMEGRRFSITTTGKILGTPAYMAPEQMLGYRADHRSDIYSIGMILFELLTGRRPTESREEKSLTLETMNKGAPKAAEIRPNVPVPLSDAIARALAWNPDERQQSATELGREIERGVHLGEDEQTLARPPQADAASHRDRRGPSWRTPALAAAAVLVALVVGWLARRTSPPSTPDGPAVVAVLPLENVSGDPEIDHVGLGIAHTLITKLSALPSITMVSRPAVREYEAAGRDTRALAHDLGATFVVNGSIQRVGETVHITANLVRSDDSIAWGGEFEGNLSDLFELQRRLAAGLTDALDLNLTPQQKRWLDAPLTANANAYAEYSQGRYFLERARDAQDLSRAIQLLESAVERDGKFALAWAALGKAYWGRFEKTTEREWTIKAREAAEHARQLDPDHPSVHYALAIIYKGTGETARAIDELARALTLQPNYDDAYRLQGEILASQGDIDAAAEALQKAIAIRPSFWGHYRTLGLAYYRAGRLPDAATAFQRVTELRPDLPTGFQMLGATYHTMGDLDRAVPNYLRSIELSPNAPSLNNLGTVYYRQGKYAQAAESYERALALEPSRAVTHRNLGDAYRRLGETAKARAAYERAAELHRNILDVNPKDARTTCLLALMQAKLEHFSEATRLANDALAMAPRDGQVWYHNAVIATLEGRTSDAIDSLEKAIENGYGVSEIREDDDLDPLRKLQKFQSLLHAK